LCPFHIVVLEADKVLADVHTNQVYPGNRLLAAGLKDGGTAGLIWAFVGVSIGFTLVYASIAEMASMYVDPRVKAAVFQR